MYESSAFRWHLRTWIAIVGNGRTCVTCHEAGSSFGLRPFDLRGTAVTQ